MERIVREEEFRLKQAGFINVGSRNLDIGPFKGIFQVSYLDITIDENGLIPDPPEKPQDEAPVAPEIPPWPPVDATCEDCACFKDGICRKHVKATRAQRSACSDFE